LTSDGITERQYHFDPDKPFFKDNNGGPDTSLCYQFSFANWYKGQPLYLPPSIYYFKNSPKFQVLGASIRDLYHYAYYGYRWWNSTSEYYGIVWPEVLVDKGNDSLIKLDMRSRYCISLELKDTSAFHFHLQRTIKDELDHLFACQSVLEIRRMPCWFLQATDSAKIKLRTGGGEPKQNFTHAGISLINQPLSVLLETLFINNQMQPPFIDQTGIDFKIDLKLEAIMFDIKDVQKALLKQGLRLIRGEREMNVIVLKPKNKNVAANCFTATFE
jgi:hypothetical protein